MKNILLIFCSILIALATFSLTGCQKGSLPESNHATPTSSETSPASSETTPTKDPYTKPFDAEVYVTQYFSFFKPLDFKVTTNNIRTTYSNGKSWHVIEFKDENIPEKPVLHIDVNPDGYGPFFADIIIEVVEKEDGEIDIVSEEIVEKNENNDDGQLLIITNSIDSHTGKSFFWRFQAEEGGRDFEPIFKTMLNSFVLQDVENPTL